MVTIQITCRHRGSENVVRNGMTSDSKRRFLCKGRSKDSRQDPRPNGYTERKREEILGAYRERSGLGGISRTFGVSPTTVASWLEKSPRHSRS